MANYLSPLTGKQFIDANGNPYSGAKLFTYVAGSSTKVTVYKDSSGSSSHTNPIILNTRGEIADLSGVAYPIWQAGGASVKYVLAPSTDTDPPASPIETFDNIDGINDTSVTIDQWITGLTPTYVGATSFTLVGDQTTEFHIGRRIKTTNSGGTVYSTITNSVYTSLTTVTVVNDSGTLDAGLSAVSYGILGASNTSIPGVKLNGSSYTHQGTVTVSGKSLNTAKGANVASAATCDIWTPDDGNILHITGTTGISSLGTAPQAGAERWLIFDDVVTLTAGANLVLNNGGSNITTATNTIAHVVADTTTKMLVTVYHASGYPAGGYPASQGCSVVGITSKTASNSATLDFTTEVDWTAYNAYEMELVRVIPATNATFLYMHMTMDAGSNWETGASDYLVNARFSNSAPATGAITGANSNLNLSDTTTGVSSSAGGGISGKIILYSPNVASTYKEVVIVGLGYFDASSNNVHITGTGAFTNGAAIGTGTAAVNGIRFIFSAGNITSGTIYVRGIKTP